MKYQSVLFASMRLHNIKEFPPLPQEPKNLEFFFFFFLREQPRLSPVSASLKRRTPLMIQDTRRRDLCQQSRGKKQINN